MSYMIGALLGVVYIAIICLTMLVTFFIAPCVLVYVAIQAIVKTLDRRLK